MRHLQPSLSGLATIAIGIAAAFQSASATAQPIAPCAQIRAACEQAGFVQGAVRDGYGLQIDCVRPIMQEMPQPPQASKPLPQINPELIAACREKNPNFGGPRASASDTHAPPPAPGRPSAPDQLPTPGQPAPPTQPSASDPSASTQGQTSTTVTQ
jgi:hypothetical protein